MKIHLNISALARALIAVALLCSICEAQTVRRWEFGSPGNREGWSVRYNAVGAVMGGALWLTLNPEETDPNVMASTAYQAWGDAVSMPMHGRSREPTLISSPAGLDISAAEVTQVRLKVLNHSPTTDFYLRWKTLEEGWGEDAKTDGYPDWGKPGHSRRCTMKANSADWQEVVCYVDREWTGTIDQIALLNAEWPIRGDLWIAAIEIAKGPAEPIRSRPDVMSEQVVPRVVIPGISQDGFAGAFRALDQCLVVDVPFHGFTQPFMSPGGYYRGGGWWLDDTSLTVIGAKWVNEPFAEGVMRGFQDVQAANPDGRIDMWGLNGIRGQAADLTGAPYYFEVAYTIARRTSDAALREHIYESMKRYLDWWLSPVKRDAATGLVSAIYEEGFTDPTLQAKDPREWRPTEPMTLAPVDVNVLVAVGVSRVAELAAALGRAEDAARYGQAFHELSTSINAWLWNDERGAYFNYNLRVRRQDSSLNIGTFFPLRLAIAPKVRRDRLLKELLNPKQFNWGRVPLTTWSMTDPGFVEAKGDYDGRAWFGDVWMPPNATVIKGLEESGRSDLAAELAWSTITSFHAKYREFLLPSSGDGQGADNYGWTASQYIGLIIEHLFGVEFDGIDGRIRISPHLPKSLYGKELELDRLLLPEGRTRMAIRVKQSSSTSARIRVQFTGELPSQELEVSLPAGRKIVAKAAAMSQEIYLK